MTTQFVLMYHPALGNRQATVPLQSADDHASNGWLLVDPAAEVPASSVPYLTQAALLSQISTGAAPVGTALRAALGRKDEAPIKPVMVTYPQRTMATRRVLFHTGSTYYATLQSTAGTLFKSTDNGTTWTQLAGALGFEPWVLLRKKNGTLIAVGQNPTATMKRSTDDGATWTTVTGALNFAPLGHTGITETPSGHVLIAEYGNTANTVYRVRRSTDDGATWATVLSSPGTDASPDVGHFHSVTYDKPGGKFLAFMDRQSPELYSSLDEGATWTKFGTQDGNKVRQPNFVAPMFFADHVAWGYDNAMNGTISRMPRADFYAGNWGVNGENVEVVAEVTGKAFYETFPIDADTWLVSGATEHISGLSADGGSFATEVYVVYDGGARVAGGLSHATPTVDITALQGQKARFAGYVFDEYDHDQRSWINLNTANVPYPYASVPFTVARAQDAPQTVLAPHGPLIVHSGSGIYFRDANGVLRQILNPNDNWISYGNPMSSAAPEMRNYAGATGIWSWLFNGAAALSLVSDGRIQLGAGTRVILGSNGPEIHDGTGSPEGVKTAPPGSLYLNRSGGAGTSMYVKESGTGNTGWVAK